MAEKKLTSRMRANKNWDSKNPERVKYRRKKSAAKTFLLKDIEAKDLDQFIGYLEHLKVKREIGSNQD